MYAKRFISKSECIRNSLYIYCLFGRVLTSTQRIRKWKNCPINVPIDVIYFSIEQIVKRKYLDTDNENTSKFPQHVEFALANNPNSSTSPINQPTNQRENHPLKKKEKWKIKHEKKGLVNCYERQSVEQSGVTRWFGYLASAFGKWKLNEIRWKIVAPVCETSPLSLFLSPHGQRSSKWHVPPNPVESVSARFHPLSASPCTRNPLVSSHFWHRLHFHWNNRPEAFSISITASRAPRATSVTNQQRHSRVIGFYVMLSSRELRASADLFSVRVSPRYSDQSLDLELIKYQLLLVRAQLLFSFFFFLFFLFVPLWFRWY